jgi:hypothetical protein
MAATRLLRDRVADGSAQRARWTFFGKAKSKARAGDWVRVACSGDRRVTRADCFSLGKVKIKRLNGGNAIRGQIALPMDGENVAPDHSLLKCRT